VISDGAMRRHEAAHAAAAVWLGGRSSRSVRVDHPDVKVAGQLEAGWTRDIGVEDLVIALIGWLADGEHPGTWPPSWPVAEDEIEGVGLLVNFLGLTEEAYGEVVRLTEGLLANEDFRRLMSLISRALCRCPVIDGESVDSLRRAAGIPDFQREGAALCST
jgi:hypothetical protein